MQNDSFVMLSVTNMSFMPSVTNMSFMLSVIMLNVVMLIVVDPPFRATGRVLPWGTYDSVI